jgi:hypothetical protein
VDVVRPGNGFKAAGKVLLLVLREDEDGDHVAQWYRVPSNWSVGVLGSAGAKKVAEEAVFSAKIPSVAEAPLKGEGYGATKVSPLQSLDFSASSEALTHSSVRNGRAKARPYQDSQPT